MNLNPTVTHDDLCDLFTTVDPPGINSQSNIALTQTRTLNTTFLQTAWVSSILKASCRGGKWRTGATLADSS